MTIYYNSDLNSSNPLPAQFKKVYVVENSGSNGKTVYEFTSDQDFPVWALTNTSFSMKQRFPFWAYGLPKKTTVYDVSGTNPIQQTEYIYDPSYLKENIIYKGAPLLQCSKCLVTASASQNSDDWKKPGNYDAPDYGSIIYQSKDETYEKMIYDPYQIYTGRLPLQITYERIFKKGSSTQYLETATQYEYNPGNYQVSAITTTLSNGDKNYKTIRYDNSLLVQNNIIATPFETATFYTKNNSSAKFYTGESVTEYATIANGNIVPSKTLVQRFAEPKPSASMLLYGSNPTYKETQSLIYDANSNLIGMKDEGNHIVTNIYDYNDKYVIASVINADPVNDKSAYTSFETSNMGGWQLNGTAAYNYNLSVTGNNSFVFSSSNSLASPSLNTSKSYIISFWATSPVTVTNSTLIKTATNINEFIYYEYKVANVASVTISGNANIDELRLYPQNARMRTVTYDPLIGKTSECDENNRISYYEYDELGRLRFIKNENKNIVKMYEYNLKSKVNNCPATYHNLLTTEVYTKNNCAAGYIGSEVIYIIPDSKYTSSISQEDVDQKVQAELDAMGQNYANTNGTCTKLYYNAPKSTPFTKEGCDIGYKGTTYTYSVPYGRFTSIVSQSDADAQAQEVTDANGQSLANLPGNASCIIDNAANYQGDDNAPTQCQVVNGANTGHQLVLVTDINPNSTTYNHTQWADMGVNLTACPVPPGYAPSLSGTGYQTASGSGFITGQPGTPITIKVTLNSSDPGATLNGNAGVSIQLSGSGNHSVTNIVNIPATGYINWNLTLTGNLGTSGGYISSSISF